MAKTPSDKDDYSEKEALERMNKALKGAIQKGPETHEEMARRRNKGKRKAGASSANEPGKN